ncbi:M20 metallopeptidase family protein [Cryptosporangium arvum]|uniref:M20 metallopeptidase family protein n=1 Tax=Cryptosporangium arvum TaxID=80871 RepID=UPI0004ADFD47|nr:amidohydrolase [Cryptosporangium arvum]
MDELADAWRAALADELPGAVALRHELHANPDVSGAEDPTADRVVAALGLPAERIAGTGRLLRIGPDGPSIGLRAEMDALPVTEATGAPFAAGNGAMHACGHDVHLAALVAVVRAARRLELPRGLVVVLQPREEVGPTGAIDVVTSGRLLDHQVRALIAAHVQPLVAAGRVTSDPGPVNASVDEVDIVITGRGGHGAYPHLAADPVPVLCRAVLALGDAARAAVDPLHPVVVTFPQIEGSGAPNVIPGTARASGTVRAMREEDRTLLHERLARTVDGIAAAGGCVGEYRVRRGEPALVNDPALAASAGRWLRAFGVPGASFASCGSDDFATYGPQVPILMHFVGTGEGPAGPMLHDARYLPDDQVISTVATALLGGWLGAATAEGT